jgi:hypothetical protein
MGFALVLRTMTLKASGFKIGLQTIHTFFATVSLRYLQKSCKDHYGKSLLSSLSFQSTLAPLSSCIFFNVSTF